jgi:peptidoglycan/LPS O-acetylase OafA/YrhL
MNRIGELDGLRFLAILAVLLVHYRPPFRPALDVLSLGWSGVDLFFVISGFLITTILVSLRGTARPYRVFYGRRALRIFPPYYSVLLLLSLAVLLTHSPVTARVMFEAWTFLLSLVGLPHQLHGALLVLFHGASLSTGRAALDNHLFSSYGDGLFVFWSLSVEELFYLIWAPIVLNGSRRLILTIGLLAIAVCPLLRVLLHTTSFLEFFSFVCRFDTLMIGSLLSLLFIAWRRGEIRRSTLSRGLNTMAVFSLLCLVPLCIHCGLFRHMEMRSTLSFSAIGYTLLGVFFASIVGFCALHAGSAMWWATALRAKPLAYIGTISYTMYLIHIPVWVTLYNLLSVMDGSKAAPGLLLVLLSVVVTLALSALSWRFFEKPILQMKAPSRPPNTFEFASK